MALALVPGLEPLKSLNSVLIAMSSLRTDF
jgi:hypothetical protein